MEMAGYDFDYEISNTGTLADLQEQVNTIHNNIFSSKTKQYRPKGLYLSKPRKLCTLAVL